MGLAGIITLLLIGILLILLEIFVVPGITIAGIGGLALLILGIYFSYSSYGTPTGHFILLGTFFAVGLILFVSYKSGAVKAMTLTAQVSSKVKPDIKEKVKIGDTGKCISRLAPMGTVLINNELLEASSKGGFIDQNTEIIVVHVIDNKIIVEPKTKFMGDFGVVAVWIIICIIGLMILLYFVPVGLWFQAQVTGVRISLLQLIVMRWRKVPPSVIVTAMIVSKKAGLDLRRDDLEAHYLAGGHVQAVVNALVSASKANLGLEFNAATAIDLAGRDILEAVHMSVNPKIINAPPVAAVAKDGIQLIAKARVTVRASIKNLVGGAGEETVLARVGEGIVSTIGSSLSHKEVLENPDTISKVVLAKGLDAGTAFEILSIDIADMDVGKNIGAELQQNQAEADLKVAEAKAEERRAMAVALEQEMKALAQEMRAKVIEAEAEIPKAISQAFREGNLGIMDYYNMKNIMADTSMRESISKPPSNK